MFIAPETGAQTTIMLATDPGLAETTGKYYDQCELTNPSELGNDTALRERLWQWSEQATGINAA